MTARDKRPPPAKTAQLRLITTSPSPGVAVVVVTGEIDMATAAALNAALVRALAIHLPVVLELDLSACTFLDCSGVRVLVVIRACATATGCLVWARNPQPLVRLVLEMTGLLALLSAPADAIRVTMAATEPGVAFSRPSRWL